jgi:hypothetical protein
MRFRIKDPDEAPPNQCVIKRILSCGVQPGDEKLYAHLLRRLRQSCYLDKENKNLDPRERLLAQYRKDGLVLFLGAGVSANSGIPNWPQLSDKLLRKSGVLHRELATVKQAFPSYITQFELAGRRLGTYRKLVEAIYHGLYDEMKCKPLLEKIPPRYAKQKKWPRWGEVLKALQANKTLEAVGDLLLIGKDGARPRRNPQIHAVLTVNADNLLELYCTAKTGGKRVVTLVDRPSVGEHPNQIPIYHLHGTLDARKENFLVVECPQEKPQEIAEELLPDIVFQESEYYRSIANPSHFVNHAPQSYLQRLNVLFIGTSLDDPNIRRWLYNSFSERVQQRTKFLQESYCKTYDYGDARFEAELESVRHFWLRTKKEKKWQVLQKHLDIVMRHLGVDVIWCDDDDYEDVRSCIRKLEIEGKDTAFGRRPAPYPD